MILNVWGNPYTDLAIKDNTDKDYRKKLDCELKEMANQELWEVARYLRELRPNKS